MGRKKTPSKILEARGSWRAKTRPDEPQLEPAIPPKPDYLSDAASHYWDDYAGILLSMGVLTVADGHALAALANYTAVYAEAMADVEKRGQKVANYSGGKSKNPSIDIMNKAHDARMKLWAEFGLTPSARADIKVAPAKKQPPAKKGKGVLKIPKEN